MTDKKLVRKAVLGDKSAFTSLIISCEGTLYGTAMELLKNHDDAGDCIQDAIITAYNKIGTLREEKYFKTWLIRILINRCYTRLNERTRMIPTDFPEDFAQSEETDRDMSADVQNTLLTLSETDRVILTLHYFEDISVKEIAAVLQISETAVKQRLSRGRQHFKESYLPKGEVMV